MYCFSTNSINACCLDSILSNITTTYSYDKYDRVTSVSDNEGNSVNYKYNDNDNDIVISRNIKNYKIIEGFNNSNKTILAANSNFDDTTDDVQVDSSSSFDNQVSNIYKEIPGYELYPLHGTPNSISGLKPVLYEVKNDDVLDNVYIYPYNDNVKRYVLDTSYLNLEYNFNTAGKFSIGMMVYPYNVSKQQTLFEGYNTNSAQLGLYIDTNSEVVCYFCGEVINTGMYINKNSWNFIGFSFKNPTSTTGNITFAINDQSWSEVIYQNVVLTNITTSIGNNKDKTQPFNGQIEMMAVANTYNSNINTLKDSLRVITKTNEFDPLKRLVKTSVNNNGVEQIHNKIEYHTTEDNEYTTKPSLESVELIYGYHKTLIRKYSYDNTKYKYNVTKIEDDIFFDKSYEYDDRGFLTKDAGTVIRYDDNGNIKAYGDKTFTYDTQIKDRLMSVDGNSITYSTSNPLLPARYKNFDFEYEGNRLTCITDTSNSEYTKYINYYYNHEGLRIKKVIAKEYFDESLDPDYETTSYYYEGNRLITEYKNSNDRLDFLYDNNGLLYGFIQNKTTTYYYLRDVLQNILGIVDTNGYLIVKYTCNAYGGEQAVIPNTQHGSYIANNYKLLGERNPFRYKGYYYDDETNLFYVTSRYYSPEFCRFISPDSIEYLESKSINGLNLYAYCGNDPVMNVDNSGHLAISAFAVSLLIGIGIGAAFGASAATYTALKEGERGLDLLWDIVGGAILDDALGVASVLGGAAGLASVQMVVGGYS